MRVTCIGRTPRVVPRPATASYSNPKGLEVTS